MNDELKGQYGRNICKIGIINNWNQIILTECRPTSDIVVCNQCYLMGTAKKNSDFPLGYLPVDAMLLNGSKKGDSNKNCEF